MDLKIDTKEFNEALRQYVELSKKDAATVLNTKAFYVARRACWGTMRADKAKVKAFTDGLVWSSKGKFFSNDTGRAKTRKWKTYARNSKGVPLIALIINKRLGMQGKAGLRGADMETAMSNEGARRQSAISFIAGGWIGSIKALDPKAEKKSGAMSIRGAKQYGEPKGGATAASDNSLSSMIYNTAKAASDKTGRGWYSVVSKGLSNAIKDEAEDTEKYMARKLQERADKFKR